MADVWANSMACHPRTRAALQGAATWRIECQSHSKNPSPYFMFFFVFLLQFWLRRAAALVLSGALAKEGVGGGGTHPPTVGRCRQFVGDGGTCSDTTL